MNAVQKLANLLTDYFRVDHQLIPQADAEAAIRGGVSFRGTNMIILIIAILIASLGLNTNSTAVIIGAMLISPLMGPIIGMGLGVGIHDFELIKHSLRNLLTAALFSVLASTIYFLISPVNEQHSELLARTSPTIYDVLIGFFGGGAGIVAIGSTNKGNVIPGAAIATALMPPLCTAGYGLATWQLNYFFGAGYLFVINSIYIALATFIGVKLMKYQPVAMPDMRRAARVMRIVYTLAILTMLPAVFLTYRMLQDNRMNVRVDEFVNNECKFNGTQILTRKLYTLDHQRYLSLTLIGRPMPADSLETALSSRLRFYGLEGTKIEIVQGGEVISRVPSSNTIAPEIYAAAQHTIAVQNARIDSLTATVRSEQAGRSGAVEVAPELSVIFPQISELALNHTIFVHPSVEGSDLRYDTTTVALVGLHSRLNHHQLEQLRQYLCTRLQLDNIDIVELPSEHHSKP